MSFELQKIYKERKVNVTIEEIEKCIENTCSKHKISKTEVINVIIEYLKSNNYVGVIPGIWSKNAKNSSVKSFINNYLQDVKTFKHLNEPILRERLDDGSLRVCTFNVHFWYSPDKKFRFEEMMKVIDSIQADVVCLQEAVLPNDMKFGSKTESTNRWIVENMVERFDKMGYLYNMTCKTNNRNRIAPSSFYGNAIFSKYRIHDKRLDILDAKIQNRCYASAVIEGVTIVCVHLDVYDSSEKTRVDQIKKVISAFVPKAKNLIICGDFNAILEDDYTKKELEWLNQNNKGHPIRFETTEIIKKFGFRDAFEGGQMKYSVWTARRVDYQWYLGDEIKVKNANVYYTSVSDHFPLVVDYIVEDAFYDTSSGTSSDTSEETSSEYSISETPVKFEKKLIL